MQGMIKSLAKNASETDVTNYKARDVAASLKSKEPGIACRNGTKSLSSFLGSPRFSAPFVVRFLKSCFLSRKPTSD